jgi:hypothetical protein
MKAKPWMILQLWKWLYACSALALQWNITALLKVENSAQATFIFSPVSFHIPCFSPLSIFLLYGVKACSIDCEWS